MQTPATTIDQMIVQLNEFILSSIDLTHIRSVNVTSKSNLLTGIVGFD